MLLNLLSMYSMIYLLKRSVLTVSKILYISEFVRIFKSQRLETMINLGRNTTTMHREMPERLELIRQGTIEVAENNQNYGEADETGHP